MNTPEASLPEEDLHLSLTLGDIGANIYRFLVRARLWLGVLLGLCCVYLFFSDKPGAPAFFLLSASVFACLCLWVSHGDGLPLMPMMAVQHLIIYGLPLLISHPESMAYPRSLIDGAGIELLILMASLGLGWYAGSSLFAEGSPYSHVLVAARREGFRVFRQAGQILVLSSTLYQVLLSADLLKAFFEQVPVGTFPLVNSLVTAATMCGFFIAALKVQEPQTALLSKAIFWLCLLLQCFIAGGNLLLSVSTNLLATVAIGLFWSRGRLPLRFIACTLALLYFFNLGKHEMRQRHWDPDTGEKTGHSLTEMPAIYSEWTEVNMELLAWKTPSRPLSLAGGQTLTERVNNLSNLLYVMEAVDTRRVPTLDGATYSLIPMLLVPRVLWPEKPRVHEGQIMLNVHFGRQDLESSYNTYIAWGLLPEACGNFGSKLGPALLGLTLGLFCAWLERRSRNKALFSLEGFAMLSIFMCLTLSYEMVASVFITSLFQSLVTIALAAYPFVARSGPPSETAEVS